MSLVSKVAAVTGASTADVLRVAREGGTTAEDWAIAHAIEAVGGRPAYELMLTAGRDQMIAEIWADSRDDTDPVTDTPETSGQDDADEPTEAEQLATEVHADVAAFARSKHVAARIVKAVAAAGSLAKARLTLYWALARHPRTSLFGLHPEPVALAA